MNSQAVAVDLLGSTTAVEVIPNAVEDCFFVEDLSTQRERARNSLGLTPGAQVIGIPGTLRPMKGHRFCLDALSPLLGENPENMILVSGETSHSFAQELGAYADGLPGGQQIRFLGSQNDMIPFYAACDVICVPPVRNRSAAP